MNFAVHLRTGTADNIAFVAGPRKNAEILSSQIKTYWKEEKKNGTICLFKKSIHNMFHSEI